MEIIEAANQNTHKTEWDKYKIQGGKGIVFFILKGFETEFYSVAQATLELTHISASQVLETNL